MLKELIKLIVVIVLIAASIYTYHAYNKYLVHKKFDKIIEKLYELQNNKNYD